MTAPSFHALDLETVCRELCTGMVAAGAPQHEAHEMADVAVHTIRQSVDSFNRTLAPLPTHMRQTASIAAMQVMRNIFEANIERAIAQFVEQGGTPHEHVVDFTGGSIQ